MTNKIALIQVWFGNLPDYFELHHLTCLNQQVDFLFFTDQEIDERFYANNIKFYKISIPEFEYKVFNKTRQPIHIENTYKVTEFKPAYLDIFREYVSDYEFVGWYDIDTLLGNIINWVEPFMSEFDIISFGESNSIYDRISGPFTIVRNTPALSNIYKGDPAFYESIKNKEYTEYDERKFTDRIKVLGVPHKILYDSSNMKPDSFKIRIDAVWSGGKVYVDKVEKLIYHFFRKKHTRFEKIGNTIVARQNTEYLDDFMYITYFTESYEPTARIFIKTLEKFSNRKCILYTVNYTSSLMYELSDQFIVRRIDITGNDFLDARGRSFNTITSKPVIQLDSLKSFPNKKFIFLDTDIYVTASIDSLAKYFDTLENYPLTNSHVHDVIYSIESDGELVSSLHALGDEIGVDVKIFPRRKTNVMLYDERSDWFFKEQMQIYNDNKESTRQAIFKFHDEDTFNIILSKYNLVKALPVVDIEEVFDIDLGVYRKYTYTYTGCDISDSAKVPTVDREVYVFHGYKTPDLFQKVDDTYGSTVLDKTDILIEYTKTAILFIKNSLLFDKKIDQVVNLTIFLGNRIIYQCDWEIFKSIEFYAYDIPLINHTQYTLEITEVGSNRLLFSRDLYTDY